MKSKFSFVSKELERIRNEHLYRQLRDIKVNGPFISINNKKLLNLCSNDYLGIPLKLPSDAQLQSSSRLVSGNDILFKKLENKLASHKSQEASLVFPTGYMANIGVISCLIQKNDLILSDELNHASIIDACKLSGAKTSVYKHNDMVDLEKKLKTKNHRKFIITEGVFSMDGDHANLKEITELAKKHNAVIILDDAHGDFVMGHDGKGTAEFFGVSKKIDVYISSLSKALGSFGGYIASEKNVVDLCINKAKSFIYTSALPSILVKYSISKFDYNREKQRLKIQDNISFFIKKLKDTGYEISSQSQIIPIIIGDEKKTLNFGKYLFDNGIYAQPIRFPTVQKNKARIRTSVTAWHSKSHLQKSLDVLQDAGKKFNII